MSFYSQDQLRKMAHGIYRQNGLVPPDMGLKHHFRVMSGPVDEPVKCFSFRDFREKVPKAGEDMLENARSFFVSIDAGTLEVVPL